MMINGWIMSGDTAVASFYGRIVTPILPERCPLCFQKGGDLEMWLESRAIDRHRTNSRILKRILRLGDTSDLNTALHVHGATITDNYWVKTEDEAGLTWADVGFRENYFADLALSGRFSSIAKNYTPKELRTATPELTNIGSYEKCWRQKSGHWIMVKSGTPEEHFSEIFTAALGKQLGFPMAEYTLDGAYVISTDFTDGRLNFEPMANLVQDNEDYDFNYDVLQNLNPSLLKPYLDILFMDALVFNVDRHTQNYGLLRSRETGEILSMAPNFDMLPTSENIDTMFAETFDAGLRGIDPDRAELHRICEENDVGITVMKGFAGGRLFDEKRSPFGVRLSPVQCITTR